MALSRGVSVTGTLSKAHRPRIPTGREAELKPPTVWVRIPPGAHTTRENLPMSPVDGCRRGLIAVGTKCPSRVLVHDLPASGDELAERTLVDGHPKRDPA